jgi:hypothetical protein
MDKGEEIIMTCLKIVFYYEMLQEDPTQKQAESAAENYIAQMVLSGEDLLKFFEVEVVEEKS